MWWRRKRTDPNEVVESLQGLKRSLGINVEGDPPPYDPSVEDTILDLFARSVREGNEVGVEVCTAYLGRVLFTKEKLGEAARFYLKAFNLSRERSLKLSRKELEQDPDFAPAWREYFRENLRGYLRREKGLQSPEDSKEINTCFDQFEDECSGDNEIDLVKIYFGKSI